MAGGQEYIFSASELERFINKTLTIKSNDSSQNAIINLQGNNRAFYVQDHGNLTLINITIKNGIAGARSGAIHNYQGNLTLIGCIITNNTVTKTVSVDPEGGAIFSHEGNLILINCTFTNNSANDGGAIYSQRTNTSIIGCVFVNNTAEAGGALRVANGNFTVNCSIFISNKANYGSALYISTGSVNVSFSVFYKNDPTMIIVFNSATCILKDNFYFWVNPDINNNTFMNSLFNNLTDELSSIQGFYYLNISNNIVNYTGETLNIRSFLAHNDSTSSSQLPNFNIDLWYGGQRITSYNYKTDATNGLVMINLANSVDLRYEGDIFYQIIIPTSISSTNLTNISIKGVNPVVTPVIGKTSSSLKLFLDVASDYGYLVGETATITWTAHGIANLNQIAILRFIENGKVWHVDNVMLSAGSYKHTFIMAHKTLDIFLTFTGDSSTYGSSAKVSTFVDSVNSHRTFIEIKNMSNLTVTKKGKIDIVVSDYKGNIIKEGKVTLTFDNKWLFTVNIVNGLATFNHIFLKAGNNRTLKICYLKDGDNSVSTFTTNVLVNKGTAKVNLATAPKTKTITNKMTLTSSVTGVIFRVSEKWYNTIKFYNNGKLQHQIKVPIKVNSYSTGTSILDYTFKKSHNNMTIQSILNGGTNYNNVFDSVNLIVRKT
ncbi:MAG: hypothetical protein FWH29_03530 [Methanobrevibacter sp.]|nr:hypothetical protein [Methanobrevibacter sp.]